MISPLAELQRRRENRPQPCSDMKGDCLQVRRSEGNDINEIFYYKGRLAMVRNITECKY